MRRVPQQGEVRDIPLDALVIGKGQVRKRHIDDYLDELADSIAKIGLLEPIVVVESEEPGQFEVLTGQRRFLAHQRLRESGRLPAATIPAVVLAERPDDTAATVISLTENLVRADLSLADKIDACTKLYKKYGSVQAVAEETGLPLREVREYVKFDRLIPELQELVNSGGVPMDKALRAQDAASVTGEINTEEAVVLAQEMTGMSGAQARKLAKDREANPDKPVEAVIEESKSGKLVQVIVTLAQPLHASLQTYAKEQGQGQDDAARGLIEHGLEAEGFYSTETE